ncbi:MAG: CDP-alcohol phosphatidyltransferase family protein [Myxococcota bacterium]
MKINKIFTKILTPPDKLINAIVGKGFGLKDLFTLINLVGGVAGIVLAVMGRPIDASYAVLAGFLLGDSLDGFVARLTNRSNQFGSDFDTITDHFSQCIAPAFIVFSHISPTNFKLGVALLFIIIAAGSIRHARNTAVKFSFPFCWKGLPRPVATMIIFAFFNSSFYNHLPHNQWFGAAFVLLTSFGLLSEFPFISHHGRKLQTWAIFIVVFAYSAAITQALFYRKYFWDSLFLIMSVYIFLGWIVLSRSERQHFWKAVGEWKAKLR